MAGALARALQAIAMVATSRWGSPTSATSSKNATVAPPSASTRRRWDRASRWAAHRQPGGLGRRLSGRLSLRGDHRCPGCRFRRPPIGQEEAQLCRAPPRHGSSMFLRLVALARHPAMVMACVANIAMTLSMTGAIFTYFPVYAPASGSALSPSAPSSAWRSIASATGRVPMGPLSSRLPAHWTLAAVLVVEAPSTWVSPARLRRWC